MTSKVLRVAVFMPQFKWERMNLDRVKPETHGIELVPADFNTDLTNFDGIIHKFTYQLTDGHEKDVENVLNYVRQRKDIFMIEPIEKINIFLNRKTFQDLIISSNSFPKNVKYVEGTEDLDSINVFPTILKPIEACGTTYSHSIRIVHSKEQLKEIPNNNVKLMGFPFIKHYGIVFKCYSLGSNYVMRASGSLVLHNNNSTQFDSQKPLPEDLMNTTFGNQETNKIAPSQEELKEIAQFLQSVTGIQLLGFDILRDEETNQLCIVDVNYFPCFRGIENIGDKFADFIKEKASQINKK